MKEGTTKAAAFVLLGVALALISDIEPIDVAADANLVAHHLEHLMIIFGGFSVGYGLTALYGVAWNLAWERFKRGWASLNRGGYLAAASFIIVFNFWHVPQAFTYTVLPGNEGIHFLEHAMFYATSIWLIAATPFMSRTFKAVYIFVFGNMNSMMGVLYSVWGTNLFAPYPAFQQDQFGLLMSASGFLTMSVGTFLYVYLTERRANAAREREAAAADPGNASSTHIVAP
ncbi:MAG TPA: hypothetical protein VMS77_06345 [Conexivisphaerales archaeon]|nr:hypothetical protein [Conexivisphaerales archaeon]